MFQLEFNDHIARILFDTLQAIYTIILTPLSLYYTYQLWKLHKQRIQFIDKRRPQTVILVVLILNIYMIIIEPIVDISNLKYFEIQLKPIDKYMIYIRSCLLHTIHLLLYSVLYRLWLLYYDYIRSKQSLSMQWKIHLLHNNQYIPWTLRWKWLGKANIMFIIVITLWLLSLATIIGGIYVNKDYFGPLRILLTIPLLLGSIIISFKIRRCRDLFLIKKEVMCIAISIIIGLILAIIGVLFSETFSNFRVIFRNILSGGFCYSCAFISTQWVIKQYKKELIKKQLIESSKDSIINKISFKLLLSTKDGFKCFANHLVKELSAEHLFFLYEMMTFKKDLIDAKILSEDNAEYMIPMNYIQNKRKWSRTTLNMNEINSKLLYIIEEYIDSNGDYPVNISHDTRNNIMNILNDINIIPNNLQRPRLTMVQTTTNSFNTFNNENNSNQNSINNNSNRTTPLPTPDKLYVIHNEQNKFQLDGMEIIYEDKNEKNVTPVGGDELVDEKQVVFSVVNNIKNIKVDNIQISANNTPNITPNTLDVMCQMDHISTTTPITPNIDIEIEENVMKINGYIEKFDIAIMEVSRLLRGDSLFRFYQTEEYQILYENNYSK